MPARSYHRLLVVLALLATLLGGAYVAYREAGGFGDGLPKVAAQKLAALGQPLVLPLPTLDATLPDGSGLPDETAASVPDTETVTGTVHGIDPRRLDDILPAGLANIEGMGGRGYARQVKSGGIWFPVFNLANARRPDGSPVDLNNDPIDSGDDLDPSTVEPTVVPLTITSSPPARGSVAKPLSHQFSAIGGTPPYFWSMQMVDGSSGSFTLDAATGLLSGTAAKPLATSLTVTVTDSAEEPATASVVYPFVIVPADALAIRTRQLRLAVVEQDYSGTFTAVGGVKPYSWSFSGLDEATWSIDSASGVLTGKPDKAGEHAVQITVTDAQGSTDQATLPLVVSAGLEITTLSPLLPIAPGTVADLTFEATGGTHPYEWKLISGSLPLGWVLTKAGQLTGSASQRESTSRFTLEVRDRNGLHYRKAFELAIRRSLVAVPSRERVGLAWRRDEVSRIAGGAVAGFSIMRRGADGQATIYYGGNTNLIDRTARTGGSYDYTLTAYLADGRSVPIATTRVDVLPMTLQRGVPGLAGDPFADRVTRFEPLTSNGYGAASLPLNVTGPPDGRSTFAPASAASQVASLHASSSAGGSVVLEFTDNIIELGPGADFTVFENVFFLDRDSTKRFMEPAIIEVALFEGEWLRFPTFVNPPPGGVTNFDNPAYYAGGFAGVNATTGDDPTNPSRSGGDSFDANALLAAQGLSWVRFIRIQSTGDGVLRDSQGQIIEHRRDLDATSGGGSSGFDLDAVSAVNY